MGNAVKLFSILRHKYVCHSWGAKRRFGPHVQFRKWHDCYYLRLAWYGRASDWHTLKGMLMCDSNVRDIEFFLWRKSNG